MNREQCFNGANSCDSPQPQQCQSERKQAERDDEENGEPMGWGNAARTQPVHRCCRHWVASFKADNQSSISSAMRSLDISAFSSGRSVW